MIDAASPFAKTSPKHTPPSKKESSPERLGITFDRLRLCQQHSISAFRTRNNTRHRGCLGRELASAILAHPYSNAHLASPFAFPLPSRARDETRIPMRRASPFAKATEDKTENKLIRANGFMGRSFLFTFCKHSNDSHIPTMRTKEYKPQAGICAIYRSSQLDTRRS